MKKVVKKNFKVIKKSAPGEHVSVCETEVRICSEPKHAHLAPHSLREIISPAELDAGM